MVYDDRAWDRSDLDLSIMQYVDRLFVPCHKEFTTCGISLARFTGCTTLVLNQQLLDAMTEPLPLKLLCARYVEACKQLCFSAHCSALQVRLSLNFVGDFDKVYQTLQRYVNGQPTSDVDYERRYESPKLAMLELCYNGLLSGYGRLTKAGVRDLEEPVVLASFTKEQGWAVNLETLQQHQGAEVLAVAAWKTDHGNKPNLSLLRSHGRYELWN